MKIAATLLLLALGALHLLVPTAPLSMGNGVGDLILYELRLPRSLLVIGYGATLGISGAAIQAVFANPLASPDISGASSGAALGAVVGGYWLGLDQPFLLSFCGAAGALGAMVLLFLLAGRRSNTATLLLAGLAISLAAGAATSLALALSPSPFAFYDALDWLMGSVVDRSMAQALGALVPAALACGLLLRRSRSLDLLVLGEDAASAMGISPRRLAREVIVLSAIAIGACVAVAGAIGFVGLVAPVVARATTRGRAGTAMLAAGLFGAILLTAADVLVKSIDLDRPIPIGVVTALFGTPLFLWLIVTMRRVTS